MMLALLMGVVAAVAIAGTLRLVLRDGYRRVPTRYR